MPSAARPPKVPATAEDTSQAVRSAQSLRNPARTKPAKPSSDNAVSEDLEPFDPREAEILKLVAADTPSHRGAWRKDSRAWQLFVRRQGDKDHQGTGLIPEETEDDTFGQYADDDSDGDSDSDVQRGKSSFNQIILPCPYQYGCG
jgi:hypothetical protein